MPVRAITFDFWRTLFYEPREPVERRRLRSDAVSGVTGVTPERATEALLEAEREFLRHHITDQRTLGPRDAVEILSRLLDVPIDRNDAEHLAGVIGTAILHFPPAPVEGALDAVRAAAARVPVGIISDSGTSPGSSLRVLLDRFGFLPHFRSDAVVFSDEVGVAKPQAPMFETAARGLDVAVQELLHVGDLEGTDVRGAKGVGGRAALFAGDNTRHAANTTADYVFTSWREFIDALPALLETPSQKSG
jgi:putative hydrolase of the HAD superfamily